MKLEQVSENGSDSAYGSEKEEDSDAEIIAPENFNRTRKKRLEE